MFVAYVVCCLLCPVFCLTPPPLSFSTDDANCAKVFPLPSSAAAATTSSSSSSGIDRNWDCSSGSGSPALNATELLEQGYQFDVKLGERTTVDLFSLQPFVENGDDEDATGTVNICLIVTRRVVAAAARDNEGKGEMLMHKYFCNGAESALNAHETWSSSKIFAIANAAGALREREGKEGQERGEKGIFGIQSSTTGKHGETPLGDLSTIVCSYDTTEGYSSNSLSSYFHDIGWRSFANALVNTTAQTQVCACVLVVAATLQVQYQTVYCVHDFCMVWLRAFCVYKFTHNHSPYPFTHPPTHTHTRID